jgi:putative oxidoreductase
MFELLNSVASLAHNGIPLEDVVFTVNRVAMGLFFAISGYHKLFNAKRHASIASTMVDDGVPFPKFNEWFVPFWEFTGGLGLIAGIFAPFFAGVLIIVCLVATCVDGVKRIKEYEPIDKADWLDDLLYLPEVLYIIGLVVVVVAPGYLFF